MENEQNTVFGQSWADEDTTWDMSPCPNTVYEADADTDTRFSDSDTDLENFQNLGHDFWHACPHNSVFGVYIKCIV